MKLFVTSIFILSAASFGCLRQTDGLNQQGSGLSEITLNLPDRPEDKKKLLAAFQLQIMPDNEKCAKSKKDTTPTAWPEKPEDQKLGGTVQQGCGYYIRLDLGEIKTENNVKSLAPSYFSNADASNENKGQLFPASDIKGESITITLTLKRTPGSEQQFPEIPFVTTPKETSVNINVEFGGSTAAATPPASNANATGTVSGFPTDIYDIIAKAPAGKKACLSCHNNSSANPALSTPDNWKTNTNVLAKLQGNLMPPPADDTAKEISADERQKLIGYINGLRK